MVTDLLGEGGGMRITFPVMFDMLNWIPVPWLQGECECQTESMKWWLKIRSCKLLNGIFSIYAVYSCLWVGENDQANKKSNKNLVELWYFVFLAWGCGGTVSSFKNECWAHLHFFPRMSNMKVHVRSQKFVYHQRF